MTIVIRMGHSTGPPRTLLYVRARPPNTNPQPWFHDLHHQPIAMDLCPCHTRLQLDPALRAPHQSPLLTPAAYLYKKKTTCLSLL